jgi:hypothetical protein
MQPAKDQLAYMRYCPSHRTTKSAPIFEENTIDRAIRRFLVQARSLGALNRWLGFGLVFIVAPRATMGGLTVRQADNMSDVDGIDRLRFALRMIEERLPGVYSRLQRELRSIVILRRGAQMSFCALPRCMFVGRDALESYDLDLLAASIVHEATHARLYEGGFGYSDRIRPRVERICVRGSIRLARLLPRADQLSRVLISFLREPQPWYTRAARIERRVARWRERGWPEWFIRPYSAALLVLGRSKDARGDQWR